MQRKSRTFPLAVLLTVTACGQGLPSASILKFEVCQRLSGHPWVTQSPTVPPKTPVHMEVWDPVWSTNLPNKNMTRIEMIRIILVEVYYMFINLQYLTMVVLYQNCLLVCFWIFSNAFKIFT